MLSRRVILFLCILMLTISLSSCEKTEIKMIVPSGSPQFAQLHMQASKNYDVTIIQGADPLVAAFSSESYDVICAPTNLGAKLYDSKPTYQLIASITWGNYYLISKSEINLEYINEKEIVAFGRNQTPDAILQYVFEEALLNITYLDSLTSVVSDFLQDGSKIYLVAEPSLSVLTHSQSLHIIDIQALYQDKTLEDSYPQASVFVHRRLTDRQVDQIKKDLKNSIYKVTQDVSHSADVAISLNIQIEKAILESVFQNSHIEFKDSMDAKDDIIYYLEMLKAFNENFVGAQLPSDDFYR